MIIINYYLFVFIFISACFPPDLTQITVCRTPQHVGPHTKKKGKRKEKINFI